LDVIYPSFEFALPETWSLSTRFDDVVCQEARAWVESQERVLPLNWRDDVWEKSEDKILSPRHQLQGVLIRFKGTMLLWKRVEQERLFGFDENRASPILGGGFKEERLLHFELALRSEKLTLLSLVSDDLLKAEEVFLSSSVSEELRKESSYRLMSVTQPLESNPHVEMGLSMDWTDLFLEQIHL